MKILDDEFAPEGRVRSEGKLLEIMPVITDATGQPYILPPVVYRLPNELLGFREWHTLGSPLTYWGNQRTPINGSSASMPHDVSFYIRVLEDSPSTGVQVAVIDEAAVAQLLEVIKEARKS